MKNFSYMYLFLLFIIQLIGLGIHMARFGEERISVYDGKGLYAILLVCILSGVALLWWPT
jgi:hypothetical protein